MTRQDYVDTYNFYYRMPTPKLQRCISNLYTLKFEDNDISVYEEHRIASRVLIERQGGGVGLIFHMKNLQAKKS